MAQEGDYCQIERGRTEGEILLTGVSLSGKVREPTNPRRERDRDERYKVISSTGWRLSGKTTEKTVTEQIAQASPDVIDRIETLKAFLIALGDDVQVKILKFYLAFRRIKNFACIEVHAASKRIAVFVKVNPDTIQIEPGFTRDVRNVGYYGTGDLEIIIQSNEDLERAKPLLLKSYEAS